MPAGLRSQTPMNQTASKPNLATASHSTEGTELKSTCVPVFRLSSDNQTQVLISYKVGYRGQIDMIIASLGSSFTPLAPFVAWVTTALWYSKTHLSTTEVFGGRSRNCQNVQGLRGCLFALDKSVSRPKSRMARI